MGELIQSAATSLNSSCMGPQGPQGPWLIKSQANKTNCVRQAMGYGVPME